MSDFDLDLRTAEQYIDDELSFDGTIVLGILDGSTPDEEWLEVIGDGNALALAVDGDVNDLAAGFAREVKSAGGSLVHFRGLLLVTPPDVTIDTDRL